MSLCFPKTKCSYRSYHRVWSRQRCQWCRWCISTGLWLPSGRGGGYVGASRPLPTWNNDRIHHDDVIKWKYFPRYWPFVRGNHRPSLDSPHKGQWRGALVFSLMCAWKKRLSKDSRRRLFQMPSRSLWRRCNDVLTFDWKYRHAGPIDQSHNAPISYPTMHHFATDMCTFLFQSGALWDMEQVHCGFVALVHSVITITSYERRRHISNHRQLDWLFNSLYMFAQVNAG